MRRRRIIIGCLVVTLITLAIGLLGAVQVCRDWAFVCENTGSHKGYREWPLGLETGHWYRKSPLEEFLETQASDTLAHRWTSYAGTGRNVYGSPTVFGHATPGAVLQLNDEVLRYYVERHSPEEVSDLYDLFVSDDQDKIERRVKDIWDEFLDR